MIPFGTYPVASETGPDEAFGAFSRDCLEDELVLLLVKEEDGRGARVEDRPCNLDDRTKEILVALLGTQDAGCDRGSQVVPTHRDPITFEDVR
jgi:hypothetical protein